MAKTTKHLESQTVRSGESISVRDYVLGDGSAFGNGQLSIVRARYTMTDLVHALRAKDGTLITEMRLSDGYVNATKMTKVAKKQVGHWLENRKTKEYLEAFADDIGKPIAFLVQRRHGLGSDQATWVHPEIAVDVAAWCCPAFKIQVNRLVVRYLTGQITRQESQAAAQATASVVDVIDDTPQVSPQLIQWNRQRDDSRQLTKAKSDTLKEVTGGKAYSAYWRNNDAINKAATGKTTKELRVQLGIKKGTPRDRMGAPMLGMIAYQEGMVDKALREAKEDKGEFLKDWEAIGVAETVTDEAEAFCNRTKGFELPMLQYKPPQVKQVQKALQAKKPTMRQQRLITAAMMPILKSLPAPPSVHLPIDTGDLYDD